MQLLQFPLLPGRGVHESLHTHECNPYCGVRLIKRETGDIGTRTFLCQLRVRRFEHLLQRCLRRGICDPTPHLRPEA